MVFSQWPAECMIYSALIRFFLFVSIFFDCHTRQTDRQAIIRKTQTQLLPPLPPNFFFLVFLFRTPEEGRAGDMHQKLLKLTLRLCTRSRAWRGRGNDMLICTIGISGTKEQTFQLAPA